MSRHYIERCNQCIKPGTGECNGTEINGNTDLCEIHGWMTKKRTKKCIHCGGINFTYFAIVSSVGVKTNEVGYPISSSRTNILYFCTKCESVYKHIPG